MTALTTLVIILGGWIFSLCLHEWAHAATAFLGGDTTVREKGYLSFNPVRYTDPMMSIGWPLLFLALGGIGLPGGAVWIETWRLRGPRWRSAVAIAGPAANLVLALVLALVWKFASGPGAAWSAVAFLIELQLMAVLFNLLPVPPLDGFRIIEPWIPEETLIKLAPFAKWGFLVVIGLLWFVPPAARAFWILLDQGMHLLDVPMDRALDGYRALRDIIR